MPKVIVKLSSFLNQKYWIDCKKTFWKNRNRSMIFNMITNDDISCKNVVCVTIYSKKIIVIGDIETHTRYTECVFVQIRRHAIHNPHQSPDLHMIFNFIFVVHLYANFSSLLTWLDRTKPYWNVGKKNLKKFLHGSFDIYFILSFDKTKCKVGFFFVFCFNLKTRFQ